MAQTRSARNIARVTLAFAFAANGWDDPEDRSSDGERDRLSLDRVPSCPASEEERALATRLRTGDALALELLVERHYVTLLTYLTHAIRSEDIASDLLQELFVQVWRRRESFPVDRALAPYLIASARNRLLDYLRTRRRTERKLGVYAQERGMNGSNDDPLLVAEYAELARAAREAIEQLPERGREIWRLSREQGLTFPEIAQVLGISVNTVKTHMARAMTALRAALLPYLER
jgi:RNA polymerase sigma-70 factor, ECF subfamily